MPWIANPLYVGSNPTRNSTYLFEKYMVELAYTVLLPDGRKAIEVQETRPDGQITYYYQHHTIGRVIDVSKYELENTGMIKGRLTEW